MGRWEVEDIYLDHTFILTGNVSFMFNRASGIVCGLRLRNDAMRSVRNEVSMGREAVAGEAATETGLIRLSSSENEAAVSCESSSRFRRSASPILKVPVMR